jgi:biopolymer transport protein ExbD
MADISTENVPKKSRRKSVSPRLDMTPMVDLGFLLITFFMLTTTLSKPKTMELLMPDNSEPQGVPQSASLTLVLSKNDQLRWFEGLPEEKSAVQTTNFSDKGLRKLLLTKKRKLGKKKNKEGVVEDRIIVLIKAEDNANYNNLVDVLDEMRICDIQKYALVDINAKEKQLLASL